MKKILAFLLALTMVAVMGISVFADPSPAPVKLDDQTIELPDGTIIVTVDDETIVMTDIADHWGKDDIIKAVELGLMVGYPDGKFHPDDNLTVAMIYTVLARIAGADIDLLGDNWIDNAVAWAQAEGIADDSDPKSDATRAQMVAFLAAAAKAEGDPTEWAVENGILKGDENGDLMLDSYLTRAQFAAILVRYLGK